jgi:hypothetical protein
MMGKGCPQVDECIALKSKVESEPSISGDASVMRNFTREAKTADIYTRGAAIRQPPTFGALRQGIPLHCSVARQIAQNPQTQY